jgi:hypothetical protein
MPQKRETVIPTRLNDEETYRMDAARLPKGLSRSGYLRMALLEKLEREDREKTTGGEA